MLLWALMHKNLTPHFPDIDAASRSPEEKVRQIERGVRNGRRPKLYRQRGSEPVDTELVGLWTAFSADGGVLARGWDAIPTERPAAEEMRTEVERLLCSNA